MGAPDSHPDPKPAIQRFLFVSDAAVTDVDELPRAVRAVIDDAAELAQDADIRFRSRWFPRKGSGFYLHRDRFQGGAGRAGSTVLVIVPSPVLINIPQS